MGEIALSDLLCAKTAEGIDDSTAAEVKGFSATKALVVLETFFFAPEKENNVVAK